MISQTPINELLAEMLPHENNVHLGGGFNYSHFLWPTHACLSFDQWVVVEQSDINELLIDNARR